MYKTNDIGFTFDTTAIKKQADEIADDNENDVTRDPEKAAGAFQDPDNHCKLLLKGDNIQSSNADFIQIDVECDTSAHLPTKYKFLDV